MFEKEAEEYVRKIRQDVINWGGTEPEERFYNEIKFKQAYLAGAESREKRIAELEKENAELKNKVTFLEDNLRVARKDRENLQLKVGKDLKEFIKDCPYSALKLYANRCYVEQFEKAKEIIKEMLSILPKENIEGIYEITEEAEQFLHSEVEK